MNKIIPNKTELSQGSARYEDLLWKEEPSSHKGDNTVTVDRMILSSNNESYFFVKVKIKLLIFI